MKVAREHENLGFTTEQKVDFSATIDAGMLKTGIQAIWKVLNPKILLLFCEHQKNSKNRTVRATWPLLQSVGTLTILKIECV